MTDDTAPILIHALITSRYDNGNERLYGISNILLDKLQRTQNAAARLLSKTLTFDHILLLRMFLAALFDTVAVVSCFFFFFLLNVFSLGIPPLAGPVFSRENGHLGTMGEQCYALNGLPRFVNKNE